MSTPLACVICHIVYNTYITSYAHQMEIRFRLNDAETKKLIDSAIARSKRDGKMMTAHNFCKALTLENL